MGYTPSPPRLFPNARSVAQTVSTLLPGIFATRPASPELFYRCDVPVAKIVAYSGCDVHHIRVVELRLLSVE
jgi:hypothetical protein